LSIRRMGGEEKNEGERREKIYHRDHRGKRGGVDGERKRKRKRKKERI